MAQVKKQQAREAILRAAYSLFRKQGYNDTTLRQIAKLAGMSLANVYVYFNSKYEIVFELYDPWMLTKIEQLEKDAVAIDDPRQRLKYILSTMWGEIPAANNGFARNIMQALAVANANTRYDPTMVHWIETKITELISDCLPNNRRYLASDRALAHVLIMAFDGFIINHGLNELAACNEDIVNTICDVLIGHREMPRATRVETPRPRSSATDKASVPGQKAIPPRRVRDKKRTRAQV